jgi:hypothetical protein
VKEFIGAVREYFREQVEGDQTQEQTSREAEDEVHSVSSTKRQEATGHGGRQKNRHEETLGLLGIVVNKNYFKNAEIADQKTNTKTNDRMTRLLVGSNRQESATSQAMMSPTASSALPEMMLLVAKRPINSNANVNIGTTHRGRP